MTGLQGYSPPQVYSAPINIRFPVGEQLTLPQEVQRQIAAHWADSLARDPYLFDGPLFTGRLMKPRSDGACLMTLQQSSYAHYSYGRERHLPAEHQCTSIAANALLRTTDNYWVVGQMGKASSLRRRIKLLGGAAHPDDVRDGAFDPKACMQREIREEIGINLHDGQLKYVIVRADSSLINLCYDVDLGMDSEQLLNLFDRHTSSLPVEQQEVHSLHMVEATPDGVSSFVQAHGTSILDYVGELLHMASGLVEPGEVPVLGA